MAARIVRLTAALVAAALMLILLVAFGRRGENPERALDGFRRYLPGNTVPRDVVCRSLNEYHGASGEVCTLDFTPRSGARSASPTAITVPSCQRGYLIARAGGITYLRLIGCNFPAAHLIAAYGRPQRITRFRRVVLLVWDGMSAQLRNTGWFNMMQPVSSVGWWQGPETSVVSR